MRPSFHGVTKKIAMHAFQFDLLVFMSVGFLAFGVVAFLFVHPEVSVLFLKGIAVHPVKLKQKGHNLNNTELLSTI